MSSLTNIILNSLKPLGSTDKPKLEKVIVDLKQQIQRGSPIEPGLVAAVLDAVFHGSEEGIDDRKLLLEYALTAMARLPDDCELAKELQKGVISLLYKDLPHPPSSYVGTFSDRAVPVDTPPHEQLYISRSIDGSGYNPLLPRLGASSTPYARTVPSRVPRSSSSLPDGGLVFDALLKRNTTYSTPHPGGISSLLFAFGDLIIHSCFNSSHTNYGINTASSYLDLSPLYGSTQAEVDSVRMKDGTGRLHPDAFADPRMMFMPPSVGALLVLFNRNHNYYATQLLAQNAFGTFTPKPTGDTILKQDDELFARARLINCAAFTQVILGDYVGGILGLTRDGLPWRLDPLQPIREADTHDLLPRGAGNAVSVEFNLLYRWHAVVSDLDTEWTEKLFAKVPGLAGVPFDKIDPPTFVRSAGAYMALKTKASPTQNWTFADLHRQSDGSFADGDLAKIVQDATNQRARSFGARGTPEVLRVVELLAIQQGREWGVCTLNEFRSFMGLKPYASFEEWNSDPSVSSAAKALYGDIDALELHPGLQAEESKKAMPGAGLCPGYSISRAILADAVALIRSDPYLTTELTPQNLTPWGYDEVQPRLGQDGTIGGGMLTKILYRTLPGFYDAYSGSAHFPFYDPTFLRDALSKLGIEKKYTWPGTLSPPAQKEVKVVREYEEAKYVLEHGKVFKSPSDARWFDLSSGQVDFGKRANSDHEPSIHAVKAALLKLPKEESIRGRFDSIVGELVKECSVTLVAGGPTRLDVVRLARSVGAKYASMYMTGWPLKSRESPRGIWNEEELFRMCADVYGYVYLDGEDYESFESRDRARKAAKELLDAIQSRVTSARNRILSAAAIREAFEDILTGNEVDRSAEFYRELVKTKCDDLAWVVLAMAVQFVARFSMALVRTVEYFTAAGRAEKLQRLVKANDDGTILEMVADALPYTCVSTVVERVARSDINSSSYEPNQRVVLDLASAHASKPSEPLLGPDAHPGLDRSALFEDGLVSATRAIFRLQNLTVTKPVDSFVENESGVDVRKFVQADGKVGGWPESLVVEFLG